MAGDNDLEDFARRDLEELKRVGSSDAVAVLVQLDRMSDAVTRRYLVTRGGRLERDVVEELRETNTGDPAVAASFLSWGIERSRFRGWRRCAASPAPTGSTSRRTWTGSAARPPSWRGAGHRSLAASAGTKLKRRA